MGGVCAALIYPLRECLGKRVGKSRAVYLITLALVILVLLPTALLTYLSIKTGAEQWAQLNFSSLPSNWLDLVQQKILTGFPWVKKEWMGALQDLGTSMGAKIAEWLGAQITHLPGLAMATLVGVLSFYFFLLDGEAFGQWVREISFLNREQTEAIIHSFLNVCRSVMWASVASGVVQALIFSIVGWMAGLSDLPLIALLVYLGSFIPMVGSTPITIGLALKVGLIDGSGVAGWSLGLMGGVLLLLDSVIRPLVLKGASNFHPMLAFVATLGGIHAFGVTGIFVGPILAALFVTALKQLSKIVD